jgi:hypothetical protein
MQSKNLWNDRLAMLAACGSPGSALAYHLGLAYSESDLARRNIESQPGPDPSPALLAPDLAGSRRNNAGKASGRSHQGWLARVLSRLHAWPRDVEMREREAYLAQSQNLSDLQARMRRLDDDGLSRSRALG